MKVLNKERVKEVINGRTHSGAARGCWFQESPSLPLAKVLPFNWILHIFPLERAGMLLFDKKGERGRLCKYLLVECAILTGRCFREVHQLPSIDKSIINLPLAYSETHRYDPEILSRPCDSFHESFTDIRSAFDFVTLRLNIKTNSTT